MPDKENEKEAPRELLDLYIKEVSLVDRAANKRKFLVVKRLEEQGDLNMGNFENDSQTDVNKAAKKEEDTEKALPGPLAAAVGKFTAWVKGGASGDAPKAELTMLADFLGKLASAEARKADDEEEQKKAKAKDDEVEKSEVIKAIRECVQVEKGRKRFTESRVKDLKDAVSKLVGMLSEVDEEAVKSLFKSDKEEEETKKAKAKEEEEKLKTAKVEEEDAKKAAKKKEEEDTEKAKGDDKEDKVAKALEAINKRLDGIEQTRAPTSQPEGNQQSVTKKDNLWTDIV